jgi:predicted metalloprotease with PDZ domain
LFCLLADIGIRKRTGNGKGFQDALRAVNRAGGTIEVDWPLERVIEIGDKATGGADLSDLYRRMALKPVMVDLSDLWKQLGVHRSGNTVAFDNQAQLAAIRASIAG